MANRWWKLRREAARVHEQIAALIGAWSEAKRTRQHDQTRSQTLRVQMGEVAFGQKVAVLLIYQPAGLSSSVELTCQHLVDKGYAPLVVSNAPLSPADEARLRPHCWRLVERPNFGYDFGGYRDAIWMLEPQRAALQRLLILNDSVWFPASPHEKLLDRLEQSAFAVTGALAAEDRRSKRVAGKARALFLSSFMLMVSRSVIESDHFWRFWRDYCCSDSKHRTIRRGERGFSYSMSTHGQFTIGAVHDRAQLDAVIDRAGPDEAGRLLVGMVTLDAALEAQRLALLKEPLKGDRWVSTAKELMREITDGQNFLSTAPLLCLQQLEIPVVKKSRDLQNVAALRALAAGAHAGGISLHPAVLQEMDMLLGSASPASQPAKLTASAVHPPAADPQA